MQKMKIEIADDDKEFYQLLGYAISQWHLVEVGLFANFFQFMHGARYEAVSSAFHSVQIFSAKLAMANNAAKFALAKYPKTINQWQRLVNRCEGQNTARNNLVHFVPSMILTNISGRRAYLSPSPFNLAAFQRWPKRLPRYTAAQIRQQAKQFRSLARDLLEFHEASPLPDAWQAQPEESSQK